MSVAVLAGLLSLFQVWQPVAASSLLQLGLAAVFLCSGYYTLILAMRSGDVSVDLCDPASITAMYEQVGTVDAEVIDAVRLMASGFIFTTSLPPALTAGALASVKWLKQHPEVRDAHQERAATLKKMFQDAGLPVMENDSHIVPVLVGDPIHTKLISDMLLADHGVYVQPINYPTVPRGTERLRFTPGPAHNEEMMRDLVSALVEIWDRLELELLERQAA